MHFKIYEEYIIICVVMYDAFTAKVKVTTDIRITTFNVHIYIVLIFKQRR